MSCRVIGFYIYEHIPWRSWHDSPLTRGFLIKTHLNAHASCTNRDEVAAKLTSELAATLRREAELDAQLSAEANAVAEEAAAREAAQRATQQVPALMQSFSDTAGYFVNCSSSCRNVES